MVNLDPTEPSRGVVVPQLPSVHNAKGCQCENARVETMRINHYLGSHEDYMTKTKRYWEVSFFSALDTGGFDPLFLYGILQSIILDTYAYATWDTSWTCIF